jgi:alkylation response protein AidB-like acyl-CoA dehydrogenase
MPFAAPVRDLEFALSELAGVGRFSLSRAFPDFDPDVMRAVLEGAAALADDVLAPINRDGDLHGVKLENGQVYAAPGFGQAYKAFAEGGWNSLAATAEHGGQGLPKALELAVFEMIQAANMSLALCPMLTQGAIEALSEHGSDAQKALYLEKLVSGEWTGTMNLTEPQAGSDLSQVRTSAKPAGDGSYRISGQKIFITWGDHDMADNIVHLVLARIAGAPEGVKGISLFLAPKYLPRADGTPGERNAVRAGSIEHKMGIHASPTCVMLFEEATGWLVGHENQGLAHMFTMMNSARVHVGVQGVAIAERAYQQALEYALERRQGRPVWSGEAPGRIFDHPDIRRLLTLMKSRIEAARAICLSVGVLADIARRDDSDEAREAARLRQDLLVPIAKAWSTDVGVEVASLGVQIHGGMGFIEATGAAQHLRDARIAPIYEGTNGIQAIDLMGRKLGQADGAAVDSLLADIRATCATLAVHTNEWLHAPALRLEATATAAAEATAWLMQRKGHAQPDALAGASAYLDLMGDLVGGWMLLRGAAVAADRLAAGEGDKDYWRMKISLARVFGESVLACAPAKAAAVKMGAVDLAVLTPAALGAR